MQNASVLDSNPRVYTDKYISAFNPYRKICPTTSNTRKKRGDWSVYCWRTRTILPQKPAGRAILWQPTGGRSVVCTREAISAINSFDARSCRHGTRQAHRAPFAREPVWAHRSEASLPSGTSPARTLSACPPFFSQPSLLLFIYFWFALVRAASGTRSTWARWPFWVSSVLNSSQRELYCDLRTRC